MTDRKNYNYMEIYDAAQNDDPEAIFQIATLYERESIEPVNGEDFPFWLKRFFKTNIINSILVELGERDDGDASDSPSHDWNPEYYNYYPMIIDAGIMLGLYYMDSNILEEVELAAECFYNAWITSKFDFIEVSSEGYKTDLLSLLSQTAEHIEMIKGKESTNEQ